MISLPDRASLERALTAPVRADLKTVLHARIRQTLEAGLSDLTHVLVVESADTEDEVIEAIGFSPLNNPIDGTRFGDPGFLPHWDWLQRHHGWVELIITVGDSGFAYILLIEDGEADQSGLAAMCRSWLLS